MAVFSTNQNRHLYVVNEFGDVKEDSKTGVINLKSIQDGVDKELYFVYKGADTVLKSDRIQVKNLTYVKGIKAEDLRVPFKSQLVALDPEVNGGNPVSGQDYILRIVLRQWIGMSDEDVYFKEGAVHATAAMAADKAKFYEAMVKSLNMCFSRELGATKDNNPYLSFEATDDSILITEKEQPWRLGITAQEHVLFEAQPTTVFVDGDDVIWGTVTPKTPAVKDVTVGKNGHGNGHAIADLEWFCMGERGDQYRMMGYPNYIPTTYLVDPSKEYNVLEIHHAFTDDGVSSYRSEKDITIVSEDVAVLNSIIGAINKAADLNIDTIA